MQICRLSVRDEFFPVFFYYQHMLFLILVTQKLFIKGKYACKHTVYWRNKEYI